MGQDHKSRLSIRIRKKRNLMEILLKIKTGQWMKGKCLGTNQKKSYQFKLRIKLIVKKLEQRSNVNCLSKDNA